MCVCVHLISLLGVAKQAVSSNDNMRPNDVYIVVIRNNDLRSFWINVIYLFLPRRHKYKNMVFTYHHYNFKFKTHTHTAKCRSINDRHAAVNFCFSIRIVY